MERVIARFIRECRILCCMTQTDLAKKCNMHDSAIRKYESGQVTPKYENLLKITSALGAEARFLLRFEGVNAAGVEVRLEYELPSPPRFGEVNEITPAAIKEDLLIAIDGAEHLESVPERKTLGGCIREERKKAGMTQKQLAEKSGIAINSVRLFEADKRTPKIETIKKLEKELPNLLNMIKEAGLL